MASSGADEAETFADGIAATAAGAVIYIIFKRSISHLAFFIGHPAESLLERNNPTLIQPALWLDVAGPWHAAANEGAEPTARSLDFPTPSVAIFQPHKFSAFSEPGLSFDLEVDYQSSLFCVDANHGMFSVYLTCGGLFAV